MPEFGPPLDLDRTVTLRQLRTFKTVADLKSFSLAAQHLRLSQPSVSYQVKELEEALGLPLLDRLGKSVHLTEAGSVRRRRLPVSVLAFIDFLKDTSWLSRNGARGRLRPPTD